MSISKKERSSCYGVDMFLPDPALVTGTPKSKNMLFGSCWLYGSAGRMIRVLSTPASFRARQVRPHQKDTFWSKGERVR
jgi:hypothetical protein